MSKSRWFSGLRRRTADVNVIDPGLRRSVRRRAGIALFVVGVPVWLIAAMVAAAHMHVILALLLGVLVGAVAGFLVAAVVFVWPVVRVIWHWFPEITLAASLVLSLDMLARVIPGPFAILALAVVVGGPLGVPYTRRHLLAWAWCVISRHRLRVCFNGFLQGNRDGSLPLILIARPTPVGERVWVWLRPGLSLSDLQDRTEQIAVGCWANEVTVHKASDKYAALLRFDIKRRNTLTVTVQSPLVDVIPGDAPGRPGPVVDGDVTALNLVDVPAASVTESEPVKPAKNGKPAAPAPVKPAREPVAVGVDGDDVSDWI